MASSFTIAKKEIRLLFKSKRRILLFFMVPIMLFVVALISLGIGAFFAITSTGEGPIEITIVDHSNTNESTFIIQSIQNNGISIANRSEIPMALDILNSEVPPEVLIYFPENFTTILENVNETATFYVWYNDKDIKNEVVIELISIFSNIANDRVIVEEYGELNLERINFEAKSTSTSGIGAEVASGLIIVPLYMLIFFVVPPTTLILISITQEREQKTLESLLLQPLQRKTIVLGKVVYGLFLVLSNLTVSLLSIIALLVIVVYAIQEFANISIISIIQPFITIELLTIILYLLIGLTVLSFLLISIAVFFSLIAKDEREGNMVISLLMIFPVFAILIIYAIPIHTFDLFGQVIATSLPIIGFLFALYISLLSGNIGIPAITSLFFQLFFCIVSVWLSAKLIEMEGILEVNLTQAIKKVFKRG